MSRVAAVILAAGKGTRMKSRIPKVAHAVGGRPMLEHVLRAAADALAPAAAAVAPTQSQSPLDVSVDSEDHSTYAGAGAASEPTARIAVVLGHEAEAVRSAVPWSPPGFTLTYVVQEPQLGTGDAVKSAETAIAHGQDAQAPDTILVLYGDTPLVRAETLRGLLEEHQRSRATLTFLTGIATGSTDYGRVLRDTSGRVAAIVEKRHATAEQLVIPEVNSGIYCFQSEWLWSRLDRLTERDNGEYYLTDLVGVAVLEGQPIATATVSLEETLGVNDRVQLAEAERILRERLLRDLMFSGVTVEDPATTYVEVGVRVGQDTILRPGTHLTGQTTIGERCEIGPASVIRDSHIGDECLVLASWVEGSVMEPRSRIGPMSHLRPGARLETGAHLGNFGEVKNATIGRDVQMHHFSYVGDATVGASTNIGAGVVTVNYDGKEKHHTEIGERAFIGSDTMLRAPVTIGPGASTGAGSVVTKDVPAGKLVAGVPARPIPRVRSIAPDSEGANQSTNGSEGSNEIETGDHPPERGSAADGSSPRSGTYPDR
jgi:bifunctional UDP-N-acetylglucosamine pyrophosphorylase / glucosamine-1-phosphate N-acetyltransferase